MYVSSSSASLHLACRCGAILCDSLLWEAPCSSSVGQTEAMETEEGSGADRDSQPLLRTHVEAYCDAIAEGMKVSLLLLLLAACCVRKLH